jgi:4,5-DOPA dioxygenase extradiol
MGTTPSVLFVAHGSPMFAIEPGAAGVALHSLATVLDRPRAVLVISPHWETMQPTVGTTEAMAGNRLETIHDFGGFDPRLYAIQYPACGSPQAAQEVVKALQTAGIPVITDARRGLDQDAWVPLRYLFPAADVPVVPLSIQHDGGPVHAYRVGQALAPLTEQGWLIVASGNITHNLHANARAVHRGIRDHVIAMESYAFAQPA